MNDNIYFEKIIKKKILLNFNEINQDIDTNILNKIKNLYENVCIEDGFIKKDSIEIIDRSNGYINQTNLLNNIIFNILFKCQICNPKKNMTCQCKIVEVIKPGFIAEYYPLSVIVPINLHNNKNLFKKYKENDTITIKILDSKFIKNESEIQVVGILIEDSTKKIIQINNEDTSLNNSLNVNELQNNNKSNESDENESDENDFDENESDENESDEYDFNENESDENDLEDNDSEDNDLKNNDESELMNEDNMSEENITDISIDNTEQDSLMEE